MTWRRPIRADATRPTRPAHRAAPRPRPLIERIGLAAIALVLGDAVRGVAAAVVGRRRAVPRRMGAIGCLMTLWVGR